jgi:hypothetical protein
MMEKLLISTALHSATSQKTVIFKFHEIQSTGSEVITGRQKGEAHSESK